MGTASPDKVAVAAEKLISNKNPSEGGDTDSEDDSLVVVFPPEAFVSADRTQRRLALQLAVASKNSAPILAELDTSSSSEFLQFAVTEACRRGSSSAFLVSDAELVARILDKEESANPQAKPLLLSGCVAHRRTAVLDEVLPALLSLHQDVLRWLHGASAATVSTLLPPLLLPPNGGGILSSKGGACWAKLWQFHGATLVQLMEKELEEEHSASVANGPLAWGAVYARWNNLMGFAKIAKKNHSALPHKLLAELFFKFPPLRLKQTLAADEARMANQLGRSLLPCHESNAALEHHRLLDLSPWAPSSPPWPHFARAFERLPLSTLLDYFDALHLNPVTQAFATHLLNCVNANPSSSPPHERRLLRLVHSLASKATLATVCSTAGDVESAASKKDKEATPLSDTVCPKWALSAAQALARGLLSGGHLSAKLPCEALLRVLLVFRERCEKWLPTPAMFGVVAKKKTGPSAAAAAAAAAGGRGGGDEAGGDEAGGDEAEEDEARRLLLVSLIPHARIADQLRAWAEVLWAPAEKCLAELAQRHVHAKEAGRDTDVLSAALETCLEHLFWVGDALLKCGLDDTWPELSDAVALKYHALAPLVHGLPSSLKSSRQGKSSSGASSKNKEKRQRERDRAKERQRRGRRCQQAFLEDVPSLADASKRLLTRALNDLVAWAAAQLQHNKQPQNRGSGGGTTGDQGGGGGSGGSAVVGAALSAEPTASFLIEFRSELVKRVKFVHSNYLADDGSSRSREEERERGWSVLSALLASFTASSDCDGGHSSDSGDFSGQLLVMQLFDVLGNLCPPPPPPIYSATAGYGKQSGVTEDDVEDDLSNGLYPLHWLPASPAAAAAAADGNVATTMYGARDSAASAFDHAVRVLCCGGGSELVAAVSDATGNNATPRGQSEEVFWALQETLSSQDSSSSSSSSLSAVGTAVHSEWARLCATAPVGTLQHLMTAASHSSGEGGGWQMHERDELWSLLGGVAKTVLFDKRFNQAAQEEKGGSQASRVGTTASAVSGTTAANSDGRTGLPPSRAALVAQAWRLYKTSLVVEYGCSTEAFRSKEFWLAFNELPRRLQALEADSALKAFKPKLGRPNKPSSSSSSAASGSGSKGGGWSASEAAQVVRDVKSVAPLLPPFVRAAIVRELRDNHHHKHSGSLGGGSGANSGGGGHGDDSNSGGGGGLSSEQQKELIALLPLSDGGVRESLRKATNHKVASERLGAPRVLLNSSLEDYDPSGSVAHFAPLRGHKNGDGGNVAVGGGSRTTATTTTATVTAAMATRVSTAAAAAQELASSSLKVRSLTATLEFVGKKISNETMENRADVLESLASHRSKMARLLLPLENTAFSNKKKKSTSRGETAADTRLVEVAVVAPLSREVVAGLAKDIEAFRDVLLKLLSDTLTATSAMQQDDADAARAVAAFHDLSCHLVAHACLWPAAADGLGDDDHADDDDNKNDDGAAQPPSFHRRVEARTALLDLGAEVLWRLAGQTESVKKMQGEFEINLKYVFAGGRNGSNDRHSSPCPPGTLPLAVADLIVAAYEARLSPGSLSKINLPSSPSSALGAASRADAPLNAKAVDRLRNVLQLCSLRCAAAGQLPRALEAVIVSACEGASNSANSNRNSSSSGSGASGAEVTNKPQQASSSPSHPHTCLLLGKLVGLLGPDYARLPSLRRCVGNALLLRGSSSSQAASSLGSAHSWKLVQEVRGSYKDVEECVTLNRKLASGEEPPYWHCDPFVGAFMERALRGADGEVNQSVFASAPVPGVSTAVVEEDEDGCVVLTAAQRSRALKAWLAWRLGRPDVAHDRLLAYRKHLALTTEEKLDAASAGGKEADTSWVDKWFSAPSALPTALPHSSPSSPSPSPSPSAAAAAAALLLSSSSSTSITPARAKRAHRQRRRAAAVAALLKLCPTSAVTVALVREHLRRFRDDLVKPSHLASPDQPFGMLVCTPQSRRTKHNNKDGNDDDDDEDDYEPVPWRWPKIGNLKRMPPHCLDALRAALLTDASDPTKALRERTAAATAAMRVPSNGIDHQVRGMLACASASAATEGEEAGGGALPPLPNGVTLALLKGLMKQDALAEPMRFLLNPKNMARHAELGVRPLQVITHAVKRLSPRDAVGLVGALLRDAKRCKALKVGDLKELLGMLYHVGTKAAHGLLLDALSLPCCRHPDVAAAGLHNVLKLLEASQADKLLVDEGRVFHVLHCALTNPNLPAAAKIAVFAVAIKPDPTPTPPAGLSSPAEERAQKDDQERWRTHPMGFGARPCSLAEVLSRAGWRGESKSNLTDLVRQVSALGTVAVSNQAWVQKLAVATLSLVATNNKHHSSSSSSSKPKFGKEAAAAVEGGHDDDDADDDNDDFGDFDMVEGEEEEGAVIEGGEEAGGAATDDKGGSSDSSSSSSSKAAQKARERRRLWVGRRNDLADLRALALCNLVRFSALNQDHNPSTTELDCVIEETLLEAVSSFDESDVSRRKDSHNRTKLLLEVLPKSAVFVAAHRALDTFTPQRSEHDERCHRNQTGGGGCGNTTQVLSSSLAALTLTKVVELNLAKLTERVGLGSGGRHHRTAAAARLVAIGNGLHAGDWCRFSGRWEPKLGKPRAYHRDPAGRYADEDMVKHVAAATMFAGPHRESLKWLLDEHTLIANLASSLATRLPAYKLANEEDENGTD